MLLVLLASLAVANPLPTVDALLAMPDASARISALRSVSVSDTSDAETIARAAAAVDVVKTLDAASRTDAAVVRGLLEAALSTDATRRRAALDAVEAGGLPPADGATASVDPARLAQYRDRTLRLRGRQRLPRGRDSWSGNSED
ncbi:MAG: hypothetical protein AAF602_10140 [Myxococcota bacterium]